MIKLFMSQAVHPLAVVIECNEVRRPDEIEEAVGLLN